MSQQFTTRKKRPKSSGQTADVNHLREQNKLRQTDWNSRPTAFITWPNRSRASTRGLRRQDERASSAAHSPLPPAAATRTLGFHATAGNDINLGETTQPGSGSDLELDLTLDQDVTLEDSDIALASEEKAEGGSDLDVSDSVLDSEDLVLGGSGAGSDVTIGGDSGISLVDPADSGLELDEPLELTGQEEESLRWARTTATLAEAGLRQDGNQTDRNSSTPRRSRREAARRSSRDTGDEAPR